MTVSIDQPEVLRPVYRWSRCNAICTGVWWDFLECPTGFLCLVEVPGRQRSYHGDQI